MAAEKEAGDNKAFLTQFLAIQTAFLCELKKNESTERNANMRSHMAELIKMSTRLIPLVERIIKLNEDDTRQLCDFIGKYGAVPGGFGPMLYPTNEVPLPDAKWAFSSSTTAKDE